MTSVLIRNAEESRGGGGQRLGIGAADRGRPSAAGSHGSQERGAGPSLSPGAAGGHLISRWPSITKCHCSKNIEYIKIHEVIVIIL